MTPHGSVCRALGWLGWEARQLDRIRCWCVRPACSTVLARSAAG